MSKLLFVSILFFLMFFLLGCDESGEQIINNYYATSDSLSNPNIALRVVSTNPSDNEKGPFSLYNLQPDINIQFNKLLDPSSLGENHISITEQNGPTLDLFLNYSYPERFPYLLKLQTPYVTYKAGKSYTITIDTLLEDIHGRSLDKPFSFTFLPEPYFMGFGGYPASDQISVFQQYILLSFNSKVSEEIFNKLIIDPAIKGKWEFRSPGGVPDSMNIWFRINDTLLHEKNYNVSLLSGARDAGGLELKDPYSFSFTTQPFTAMEAGYGMGIGSGGFSVVFGVSYQFNGYLDTASVHPHVSVSPAIGFDIEFLNNGITQNGKYNRIGIMFHEKNFKRNTRYMLTLSKGIRSESGAVTRENTTYSFDTGG